MSLVLVGCGARTPYNTTPERPQASVAAPGQQATESLEAFVGKVRALAAEARPERPTDRTVESHDPRLAAALLAAAAVATPATLRAVAHEYRRLQIVDKAHEYLVRARMLDPEDAATYDEIARMWRDAGFPHLGLGDAYRAVHHAPLSAAARNTLGTILQALGRRKEARHQYERALQLDPTAAYALNNLCYGWMLDRNVRRAEVACRAALDLDPALAAARNNLGLVYAVGGEPGAARTAFEGAGDRAATLYNEGIVHLAHRQYADAVTAFAAAQQARPAWRIAALRAQQAGRLARTGDE